MNEKEKEKISFFGFGAFNCALAHYLTKKFENNGNYNFCFWDIDDTVRENFLNNRKHPYHFQEMEFNDKLQSYQTKEDLIKDADIIIIGINAQAFNKALKGIDSLVNKNTTFVIVSKGIDIETHELLSDIVSKHLKDSKFNHNIAVFSGGTIASDIANRVPLIAEIACKENICIETVADLFHSDTLRIYTNTDVLSAEIAGALKNFISIGAGICEGLDFGIGTKSSLITRAAFDVYKIAKKMGASDTTFLPGSASFWGDIMLSSFGNTRNREFGKRICEKGKTPLEVLEEMKTEHKTVEGYYTVKASYEIARKYEIETPVIDSIYQIIYKGVNPKEAFCQMMNRGRKKLGL